MITTREYVRTIRVDISCPNEKCMGKMRPTGMVLLSNPPKYPHKCTGCKYLDTFDKEYPYIEYEVGI